MDNLQNQKLMAGSRPTRLLAQTGPDTRQILNLGDQKGWHFTLLGNAQLPQEPVRLDNWLIVPASQDSSEIPVRTYKRIQTIFADGIRPKGFVVIHEAPRLLSAPKKAPHYATQEPFPPEQQKPKAASNSTNAVASILSGTLFGTLMVVFGALFLGLAMIDPIVVAVMEDGCWVEIDRWSIKV